MVGKQADRALAFLDEMVRKALPLDGRSFAIGMAACSEAGKPRIDKAVQVTTSRHKRHRQAGSERGADGCCGLVSCGRR